MQAALRSYYNFVLELCGSEQDFYSRGVTLMDKVRLCQHKPHPLDLGAE